MPQTQKLTDSVHFRLPTCIRSSHGSHSAQVIAASVSCDMKRFSDVKKSLTGISKVILYPSQNLLKQSLLKLILYLKRIKDFQTNVNLRSVLIFTRFVFKKH